MTTLQLELFGGFAARADGVSLVFPTRKAQALIAYLALGQGRAFERAQLCALLWGESRQNQAFNSLRQTLFTIRKVLPPSLRDALVCSARNIALDGNCVTSDAAELARALANPTHEGLGRVAALYRGPLLDGLTLDETAFDEWLRIEQNRFHEQAGSALRTLALREEQAGALAAAIALRLQLSRAAPWDEDNHRCLMQLYAREGRRSAALAHFRVCKETLERELGVAPEPATVRLSQQIAAGEYPEGAGASAAEINPSSPRLVEGPPAASVGVPAAPLVRRERELALLRDSWRLAAQGSARVALLIGEAGVGKTRVLDVLSSEVRAAGGCVLVGRCYESEQVLPFAPWVAALRAHPRLAPLARGPANFDADEALWAELPAQSRAVLTRIFARAEVPPDALPKESVLHVFEAYLALFTRLSRGAPLLFALDDMHWADDMSLRLFSFLGRRLASAPELGNEPPVLLVGTVRKEELPRHGLLQTSLGELTHDGRALSLALEPLSQDDTSLLLRALVEQQPNLDARTEGLIWKLSEGNPLVIVEAARALAAGALASDGADLPVPERVREVIAGHIARLSPYEQRLTSLAAVVGREFELSLLCAMAERDVVSTVSAVEGLVRAGVFKESGDKLYFSHERIREVVYAGLSPQRRAMLHGHVANTLLTVHAAALHEVHGSLALHFTRAGDKRSAVTYLAAFADQVAASFGIDEALAALAQATALAQELPPRERAPWLLELSLRRAKCLFHLGRFAEIQPCLAPHLPLLDALARPELKAQVHFWIGCASGLMGDTLAAKSDGERALEEAMRCGGVKAARRAHTLLAWEAAYCGCFERGVEHGLAASVSLASADAEPEYQAAGFMVAGINYLYAGRTREARDALVTAIAMSREHGIARVEALSLAYTALLDAELGQTGVALSACTEAVALAPDPVTVAGTRGILLHVHVRAGRAEQAKQVFGELARTALPLAPRTTQGGVLIGLAEALFACQQLREAKHVANEALVSARAAGHRLIEGASLRLVGQCALALGATKEAQLSLSESRAILTEIGAAFQLGRTLCVSLALAELEGEHPRAEQLRAEAAVHYRALGLPAFAAHPDDVLPGLMAISAARLTLPLSPGATMRTS